MREQYPFFRDDNEKTQAVIGEEAANADLNGDYQKPYAILTQKRLYCKNEQGNFIADVAAIKSAGTGLLPGQNWFSWAVVACVGLALAVLCFWYWWAAGRSDIYYADYQAQDYINYYHTLEAKAEENKQTLKDYDDSQKVIDECQEQWDKNGYDQTLQKANICEQELNSANQELQQAERKLTSAQQQISEWNKQLEATENSVSLYQADLEQAKENLSYAQAQLDAYMSEEDNLYMQYGLHSWNYSGRLSTYQGNVSRYENEVSNLEQAIAEAPVKAKELRQNIADCEQKLPTYQQDIDDTQAKVNVCQEALAEYTPILTEIEEVRQNIAQQESLQASIDKEQLESEIQQFEDSKPAYKSAQSVQRNVKLFLPCLLVFAVCVVVLIVLTALKRITTAVVAALASAGIGLVCLMLLFSFRQYFYFPTFVLLIPLILAVLCMVLALWWNRKKTVFQIIHNTGVFAFTPSVYPAEELKQFAEQVGLLQKVEAGVADGE